MKFIKVLSICILILLVSSIFAQENIKLPELNDLYIEKKVKNYLPHMTWKEAGDALKHTDMAIIPLGSTEQHGYHLPLGTDIMFATEFSKIVAQYTDVLVVPVTNIGISDHHMGFAGTLTLSAETFERVIYESCECLIKHGIRKIMFVNGHGGNTESMNAVIRKINQETSATAINLGEVVPEETHRIDVDLDYHGGVNETSWMLYATNKLVDMEKAVKPVLTIPEEALKAYMKSQTDNPDLSLIFSANIFLSEKSGKKATTRDLTNTGIFTKGDPKDAKAEYGRKQTEARVNAAVKFINDWKKLSER